MRQKIIKGIILTCSVALMGGLAFIAAPSCFRPAVPTTPITTPDPVDDKKDKTTTSNRKSSSSCSRSGGGSCAGDKECEEWCDDLFSSSRDRSTCEDKTVDEVEGMYLAFNDEGRDKGFLVEPRWKDYNDIESICAEDVANALSIDEGIWEDLIEDYSSSRAEVTLYWLASESDIFEDGVAVILDDDNDDQALIKKILNEFKSSITDALTTSVVEDETDPEDHTFLSLTTSDELREVATNILLDDCLDDTSNSSNIYANGKVQGKTSATPDNEAKDAACALGEVLCKQNSKDKYIFDSDFAEIVDDIAPDIYDYIDDYIETGSVEIDKDEVDEVCEEFCSFWTGSDNDVKPTSCRS